MPEPTIVEWYGNKEIMDGCTLMVGLDGEKEAYQNKRADLDDLWGDWEPIGSAVDYGDNAFFAEFNGCPFKLKAPTSLTPHGG